MQLIVNGDIVEDPVTPDGLARAVAEVAARGCEFLILDRGGDRFMQAACDAGEPFLLEARDKAGEPLLRCAAEIPRADAEAALQSYLRGDGEWRKVGQWMERSDGGGVKPTFIVALVLILAASFVTLKLLIELAHLRWSR